jgi:hypothetical protein
MTNISDSLEAARISAGAVYRDATTAWWNAFVELHAIEWALQNSKFKRVNTAPLGFGPPPDPIAMRHPAFTTDILDAPNGAAFAWHDRAQKRMIEIIASNGAD